MEAGQAEVDRLPRISKEPNPASGSRTQRRNNNGNQRQICTIDASAPAK